MGQATKPGEISRPKGADQVVRRALQQLSQGMYDGETQKWLAWLGDGSALALTRIYSGRDLTASDIAAALQVIEMSFERVKIIEVPEERQPRTTLFVLKHLETITLDPALKNKIQATRDAVLKRTAQPN